MAILMRVGYFCSGGHTELGARMLQTGEREIAAIDAFLRKIDSRHLTFERLFPAREKPGPKHKPGRPPASLKDPSAGGITGQGLLDVMQARLTKHYRGTQFDYDAIVVIDDADCRFLKENEYEQWCSDLHEKIKNWTQREIVFFALIASPEIEAWFLADWDEGFGREYPTIGWKLRRELAKEEFLGPSPWNDLEAFGGPYDSSRGSCTRKISDEINKALGQIAIDEGNVTNPKIYTYSKRENGPDILRRIRPDEVAKACPRFFGDKVRALQAMAMLMAYSE
jgi:hypothetical protein